MSEEVVLIVWGVAAAVALVWRLMLLGAEVSDFEALTARKRNGLTRIESIQHVRGEAMWAIVAACFLSIGLLVPFDPPWRRDVSRLLLLVPSVMMAVAPIWDWIDRRRKLQLTIAEERAKIVA